MVFAESQLTKFQTFMRMFAEFRGGGAGSAPSKYAPVFGTAYLNQLFQQTPLIVSKIAR